MKQILVVALIALAPALFAQTFKVDNSKSEIKWLGKKVTGQHDGTIMVKSANIVFDGDMLKAADVVIDMTTIVNTDMDGQYKTKLEDHLKSADFFDVENHKEATFKTTSVKSKGNNNYEVTGDLTIKGITNPITFDVYANAASGKAKAKATLTFDRSKYDIKYNSGSFFSGLGDKMIYDDVEITFDLTAVE